MLDEKYFNKVAIIILIAVLIVLTFLVVRPIIISCFFGLILAFVFHPLYRRVQKVIKNKNISALLMCLLLLAIVIVPLIFLVPTIVKETLNMYTAIQKPETLAPLRELATKIFPAPEVSSKIVGAINTFTSKIAATAFNSLTEIIINLPTIFLQIFLILFLFFFGLRDGDKLIGYIESLSPLSKESDKKVFAQFKEITYSVIFGNIIVGIIHGLVTGAALFILGIPNSWVLTLIAIFFSIIPILGPWLVWVPVDIYLFAIGRTTAGIGLLIYGLVFISWIDNILRPLIISRQTKINSAIVLIGMIGGLFVFGIMGLVIGPLVIAYLLLLLESFRNKKTESIIIQKTEA